MSLTSAAEEVIQNQFSEQEKDARQAKVDEAEVKAQQLTNTPSTVLLRWLAKLGAGLVGGLGLAGVVGLIGSAVLWQRFNEAGLPASQSLAAVPDDQRIIEGASSLGPAVLIGGLAVAILFGLDRTGKINLWSLIGLGLLLVGGFGYAVLGTDLPAVYVVVLTILELVLAGVCIGIGRVTGNQYVPFALAVFVSTVVFAGTVHYLIAADQNFIQPGAVLRTAGGQGIRGFYVADDDQFIYLGVMRADFAPKCEDGRIDPQNPDAAVPLYRIPRTDSTRLLVGRLQDFCHAVAEAEDVRDQLRETRFIAPPVPNTAPVGG